MSANKIVVLRDKSVAFHLDEKGRITGFTMPTDIPLMEMMKLGDVSGLYMRGWNDATVHHKALDWFNELAAAQGVPALVREKD